MFSLWDSLNFIFTYLFFFFLFLFVLLNCSWSNPTAKLQLLTFLMQVYRFLTLLVFFSLKFFIFFIFLFENTPLGCIFLVSLVYICVVSLIFIPVLPIFSIGCTFYFHLISSFVFVYRLVSLLLCSPFFLVLCTCSTSLSRTRKMFIDFWTPEALNFS